MSHILKRHVEPLHGFVTLGGADIRDTDVHVLRQEIIVLDRSTIIETTIRDYLYLSAEEPTPEKIHETLRAVGLEKIISKLDGGLDIKIAPTGWPLSVSEIMQLKLAAAILAQPRVLIINQLFDLVPEGDLANAIEALRANREMTVIYFTNRRVDLGFNRFLYLGDSIQCVVEDFQEFRAIQERDLGASTQLRVLSTGG